MADDTKPEGTAPAPAAAPAAAPPAAAAHAAKPAAPRPPAAPVPDLAGKTTSLASAGGAAAAKPAAPAAAKAATRDADDTSPLLNRRAWMGLAWGAFSAASAAALAATGRFMFPNVLNEPPQQFKAGFPNEYGLGVDERWKEKFGIWIVRIADENVEPHGSGFYALFTICTHLGCTPNYPIGGEQVQVPVPRQRLPADRRQLRRAGAAPARARARFRPVRRWPDPRRQEPEVSVRAWSVDGPRRVSQGVGRK